MSARRHAVRRGAALAAPLLPAALLLAAAGARPLAAQPLVDASARGGVQYVGYSLGGGIDRRISELALPLAAVVPVGEKLSIDVATAWAHASVTGDSVSSRVQGLADVQLRANWLLAGDALILTAGLNLPTGHATVTEAELEAAGQIGNDFLAFPVSNLGTGFAGTGGIAAARQTGAWNLGAGASIRYAARYEPFDVGGVVVRYQPGTEYRLRVGGDRFLGAGRLALGLTYSAFGDDRAGRYTYGTGDRAVAEASYQTVVGGVQLTAAGWDLVRMQGQTAALATAPWENVANLLLRAGVRTGTVTWEPGVEYRDWRRAGASAGRLGNATLGARFPMGALTVSPTVGMSVGGVEQPSGGAAGLSGWRAALLIGYTR